MYINQKKGGLDLHYLFLSKHTWFKEKFKRGIIPLVKNALARQDQGLLFLDDVVRSLSPIWSFTLHCTTFMGAQGPACLKWIFYEGVEAFLQTWYVFTYKNMYLYFHIHGVSHFKSLLGSQIKKKKLAVIINKKV